MICRNFAVPEFTSHSDAVMGRTLCVEFLPSLQENNRKKVETLRRYVRLQLLGFNLQDIPSGSAYKPHLVEIEGGSSETGLEQV